MRSISGHYGVITCALAGMALLAEPTSAQPQVWRLSNKPVLILGADDNPHTEFHRIAGVLRLANGTLVVANGGSNEIRFFRPNGELLRTVGRSGAGPGEFRTISWFGRTADTILAVDPINARITKYLTNGTLLETVSVLARDSSRKFAIVGRFSDGRWLVWNYSTPSIYGPQKVLRDTSHAGIMGPDATGRIRWIGAFSGTTFFVYNPTNAEHGLAVGVLPLSPTSTLATIAGTVFVADSDRPSISVLDVHSSGARSIPLPLTPKPWMDSEIAPLRTAALQEAKGEAMKAYYATLYSRAILPRTKPLHDGILASSDQQLWVRPYTIGIRAESTYLVLSKSGHLVATLRSPAGFRLREVGSDYVLGVHTDADGVERVHLYDLVKGP